MIQRKVTLNPAHMQRIARYEITFKDIMDDCPFSEGDITCPDIYSITLDDLYCALKAIQVSGPSVKELRDYWFNPITQFSQAFGLDRACGYMDDPEEVPESMKGFPGLKILDSEYFEDIWLELAWACNECDEGMLLSEIIDYDKLIKDIDRYHSNRGKAIEDWAFSEEEMENYIAFFQNDQFVKEADEKKLVLARKFIDALCEKDISLALFIKGYACYGGNRLYPCDWNVSRDCMIRLFEREDDPQYANTLGYIYYYGRCNGGVPEYDKAFYYFGIAAANGLYEGMYKLADMFCHGYGCKQSNRTAYTLYQMVYEDSKKHFLKGEHTNFADAALRMGNVYARGIFEDINLFIAYQYYMQADYAAKLRAEENDFFGNTTVVINVRKALEEVETQLPQDFFTEYLDYDYPYFFEELAGENNRCLLSKGRNEAGQMELTAERVATKSFPEPGEILVTIPQLKYCERTRKASYILDEKAKIWFKEDTSQVRYDYCTWNDSDERDEFFYDDELVAWIKTEKYRIYGKPAMEPTGLEYQIASVRFEASGRTYDYICELENVHPGDLVIVEGYNGETEVTVTKIETRRESELGLPVERYKRILRFK